jgi:hypothetical protein
LLGQSATWGWRIRIVTSSLPSLRAFLFRSLDFSVVLGDVHLLELLPRRQQSNLLPRSPLEELLDVLRRNELKKNKLVLTS